MTKGLALPSSSWKVAPIFSEYWVPSWKMCPTSTPREIDELAAAPVADVAVLGDDEVRPRVGREVASRDDADEVVVGLVRSGDEVARAFERTVGERRTPIPTGPEKPFAILRFENSSSGEQLRRACRRAPS